MNCRKCGAPATKNGHNTSGKQRRLCTNPECGFQFIVVLGAAKIFKDQWTTVEKMLLANKPAEEITLVTGISRNWLKRLALASKIELNE